MRGPMFLEAKFTRVHVDTRQRCRKYWLFVRTTVLLGETIRCPFGHASFYANKLPVSLDNTVFIVKTGSSERTDLFFEKMFTGAAEQPALDHKTLSARSVMRFSFRKNGLPAFRLIRSGLRRALSFCSPILNWKVAVAQPSHSALIR